MKAVFVIRSTPGAFLLGRFLIMFWILQGVVKRFDCLIVVDLCEFIYGVTTGRSGSGLRENYFSRESACSSVYSFATKVLPLGPDRGWDAGRLFNRDLLSLYMEQSLVSRESMNVSYLSCLYVWRRCLIRGIWAFKFLFIVRSRLACHLLWRRFF